MTKEELEKEAEDFESRKHYRYEDNDYCGDIADGIIQAYLAGAEPRENRIEELEAQIERMSELINRYYMVCAEIPKEFRTMTFDSCLEDTVKMVRDREVKDA